MERRFSIATAILTVFAAMLAVMLVAAVPALAHPSEDKGKSESNETSDHDGDADSDDSTALEDGHDEEAGVDDNQHPSGKDRSEEKGGSGNQGKSESNPDDSKGPMRAEGTAGEDDKPQAGGGEDGDDQDGNNGCGNDDDFDDDNNGWCGKPSEESNTSGSPGKTESPAAAGERRRSKRESKPCDKDNDMSNGIQVCKDEEEALPLPAVPNPASAPAPEQPLVLAGRLSRPAVGRVPIVPGVAPAAVRAQTRGAVLPFTGTNALFLVLLGLGFVASGAVTVTATRKSR